MALPSRRCRLPCISIAARSCVWPVYRGGSCVGSGGIFNIPGPAGCELRVHSGGGRGVDHGERVAALTSPRGSAVAHAAEKPSGFDGDTRKSLPVEERPSECAVV